VVVALNGHGLQLHGTRRLLRAPRLQAEIATRVVPMDWGRAACSSNCRSVKADRNPSGQCCRDDPLDHDLTE